MFRKRLADKIKAGFAWSVISEDGERIPGNPEAECESNNPANAEPVSKKSNRHENALPSEKIAPEHKEGGKKKVDGPRGSDWTMEEMLDNSTLKFNPEFYQHKREKKQEELSEQPPQVKRPTAAFHALADRKSDSGDVPISILLPNEIVESSELLAETVISNSVSVLSFEEPQASNTQSVFTNSDRRRSIEFKPYVPPDRKKCG